MMMVFVGILIHVDHHTDARKHSNDTSNELKKQFAFLGYFGRFENLEYNQSQQQNSQLNQCSKTWPQKSAKKIGSVLDTKLT